MILSDFTEGSPYLHQSAVDMPPTKRDNFMEGSVQLSTEKLNTEIKIAEDHLSLAIARAKATEARFYGFFAHLGVTDAKSFSDTFLVSGWMNNKEELEILKGDKLFKKIHAIINSPKIQKILMHVDVIEAQAMLASLVKSKQVYDDLMAQAGQFCNDGPFIMEIMRQVLLNQKQKTVKKVKMGTNTATIQMKIPGGAIRMNSRVVNENLRKVGKKRKRLSFSKESIRLFSQSIYMGTPKQPGPARQAFSNALDQIAADLYTYIKIQDIEAIIPKKSLRKKGMSERRIIQFYSNRKQAIIHFVLKETAAFLNKAFQRQSAALYRIENDATGELLNFGLEVSTNTAMFGYINNKTKKIADSVGDDLFSRDDPRNKPKQSPSDLNINGILLQLKNSRSPMLEGGFEFTFMKEVGLVELFADMQKRGVIGKEASGNLAYQIVNRLHRGEGDEVLGLAQEIVNWAVELYVRSDTIQSFIFKTKEQIYPSWRGKSSDPEQIAQNSFWVVSNELIPISTFLELAREALARNKKIESWYSLSNNPFTVGMSVLNLPMYMEKLDMGLDHWQQGDEYSAGVLDVGKEMGGALLGSIKVNSVNLSNRFINNLNTIISRL